MTPFIKHCIVEFERISSEYRIQLNVVLRYAQGCPHITERDINIFQGVLDTIPVPLMKKYEGVTEQDKRDWEGLIKPDYQRMKEEVMNKIREHGTHGK